MECDQFQDHQFGEATIHATGVLAETGWLKHVVFNVHVQNAITSVGIESYVNRECTSAESGEGLIN